MAVSRTAPWWLGWMLAAALVVLFVGERVLGGFGAARTLLSGIGSLAVLGCTAWRARSWREATGEARRVQGWLLLAYVGCALALVVYLLSSEDGMRWLGIEFADEEARNRYRVALQVAWTTLLTISLLPVLGAQLALGQHRHARDQATGVETFRVLETATAGLTLALAGALLFVVGYVTSARDETLDMSYFKTAAPGASTTAMVSGLAEPLRVLLFFPDVNPVKDEVLTYFRELSDATGNLAIEEHDRLGSPRLAQEHQITQDGTVVLLHGDQVSRLDPGASLATARPYLRGLDRRLQNALLPILRRRRNVYLTTGHGELNDTLSASLPGGAPLGSASAFRELLGYLGYEPLELGLGGGLGNEVPEQAAVVAILGPRRPFLAEEMEAIERYLARGGALLLALDPSSAFDAGRLESRLGLTYVDVPLANEEQHMRQTGDVSDRRLIITDRFSSHEAVTTLARAGRGAGVLFVAPGHVEASAEGPDPVFLVRTPPSTFADVSGDYRFDEGAETQEAYALVAAVETSVAPRDGAVTTEAAAPDSVVSPRSTRALVFASSSPFTDAVLTSLGNNVALVADGVRWLAREEDLSGAIETEEDVAIVHTQEENVIWFYATILGAPALVLIFGLAGVHRRRRRRTGP